MAMFADYRNEIYRSRKWAPDYREEDLQMEELQDLKIDNEKEYAVKKKDKKWKRKTKRCEILDCAFSANSDGLSIADMADDTQLSLEELMILKEESRILHDKISKLTVRVLKLPKTESSIRKVFLPKSVAEMLVEWKKGQDKIKETLGDEYMDYNLVMATPFGLPIGTSSIRKALNDLIKEHDLPPVVFHSLRHTSVTYKLKLNGGDIKAVQGDSGHSQINMVTDVYSHIIDDDRRKNAELFEQALYEKKNLDPSMHAHVPERQLNFRQMWMQSSWRRSFPIRRWQHF